VDILDVEYQHIFTAKNGEEGLKEVVKNRPDLIISDIMMPVMDGFGFLKEIRKNPDTELIPVIFLTGKVMLETKLKSLEFGADDYITKPFEIKELLLKVQNLIKTRRKMLQMLHSNPEKVFSESQDEVFLKKIKLALEDNLKDVDLSMDLLAEQLHISSSTLQKKLKKITGKSVSRFVREYRLKRARDLIDLDYGNISEIASKTGFRNVSYFSSSYKEFFGDNPTKTRS